MEEAGIWHFLIWKMMPMYQYRIDIEKSGIEDLYKFSREFLKTSKHSIQLHPQFNKKYWFSPTDEGKSQGSIG